MCRFICVAVAILGAIIPLSALSAPLTITITEITQFAGDVDTGPTEGPVGDFYAVVTIDGVAIDSSSDNYSFGFDLGTGFVFPFTLSPFIDKPGWSFTRNIDMPTATIRIEIIDSDTFGSTTLDVSPDASRTISFTVDMTTGHYTGAVDWPQRCSEGSGGQAGRVCWVVSTLSDDGDADGDGLLDAWEVDGFDYDGDGIIEEDLPAYGADPLHKDLFVELDWMPDNVVTNRDITDVKTAFARAPITAGTNAEVLPGSPRDAKVNPDGQPGVNIWIDTGFLTDPALSEGPGGFRDCDDGLDNDGDGRLDILDPQCWVGDNLTGGNQVPLMSTVGLDDNFYAIKRANFDPKRRWIFRYGLMASPGFEDGDMSRGDTCFDGADNGGGDEDGDGINDVDFNDSDCWQCCGGQGELGGNDFIDYNHTGATLMHEVGHNLNLRHGGDTSSNCKPNYLSVMNYDNPRGIRNSSGLRFGAVTLDFSPPRLFREVPGGFTSTCTDGLDNDGNGLVDYLDPACRAQLPPSLVESNLNEATIIDPTDSLHWFVYKTNVLNSAGLLVSMGILSPADGDIDNDGVGDGDGDGIGDGSDWDFDNDTSEFGLMINIDTVDQGGTAASTADDFPEACRNSDLTTLTSWDDWSTISLPFRDFGDSANSPINNISSRDPINPEIERFERMLATTDLVISQRTNPASVETLSEFEYVLEFRNNGPNPLSAVQVSDTLPGEVTYVSDNAGCSESGGLLTCDVPGLAYGEEGEIRVRVAATAPCSDGLPGLVTNQAMITNTSEFPGPDLNPSDNSTTLTTNLADTTDPTLSVSAEPSVIRVANRQLVEVNVGVSASDTCDASPHVRLLSITSDDPGTFKPWRKKPDIVDAAFGTDDRVFQVRAERNGPRLPRVYTVTYEAQSASGNSTTATTTVTVLGDPRRQ